jgi:hypothetical protein
MRTLLSKAFLRQQTSHERPSVYIFKRASILRIAALNYLSSACLVLYKALNEESPIAWNERIAFFVNYENERFRRIAKIND